MPLTTKREPNGSLSITSYRPSDKLVVYMALDPGFLAPGFLYSSGKSGPLFSLALGLLPLLASRTGIEAGYPLLLGGGRLLLWRSYPPDQPALG